MTGTHDKGLEFAGSLPFAVSALHAIPEAADLLIINQGNEQVLRSVMMLEEKLDLDDDDPVMIELKRQDMKINLLLDMLSSVLIRFNAIPPLQELLLTDSDMSYAQAVASVSGFVEVQLYIEPSMPRPLKLFGTASFDESASRTRIVFQGMSRTLTDNLDKYIFRFHRRMVASAVAEKQSA